MDGVTTALELEIGTPDVRKFLDERGNGTLIISEDVLGEPPLGSRCRFRPARRRGGARAVHWPCDK